MKSMKGFGGMNKMLGSIRKKTSTAGGPEASADTSTASQPGASPEATAQNSVKAFCESGGNVKGDEVLFLPPIVEAAESSPAAAAECARIIRKFLAKDYASRPSWQYNAIMLVRILADNPGESFTRNFDQKFVDTTKSLLKHTRDRRVRQILMETLDDFQYTRIDDQNLVLIVEMWKVQKSKALEDHGGQMPQSPPAQHPPANTAKFNTHSQNYFARNHAANRLPDAEELVSRLEEARTSAKLLEQVVMNTPPSEILSNELIKEFSDRCLTASRSIQGYMAADSPAPDNDTMETLIDTNEQLQTALNQHKRSVLNAKKQLGEANGYLNGGDTNGLTLTPSDSSGPALPRRKAVGNGKGKDTEYAPPLGPPPSSATFDSREDNGKGKDTFLAPGRGYAPGSDAASDSGSHQEGGYTGDHSPRESPQNPFEDDPFRDPQHASSNNVGHGHPAEERLAYEPFNPGHRNAKWKAPQDPAYGDASDDDIYDATPSKKEPTYVH